MTREAVLEAMAADVLIKKGEEGKKEAEAILRERNRVGRNEKVRASARELIIRAADRLNSRPDDFFSKSSIERLHAFGGETAFGKLVGETVASGSYEACMRTLIRAAKSFGKTKLVTVQAATALDVETKARIAKDLMNPGEGIILFRIRPSLLGGMRVFQDGAMTDKSVRGRVTQLFQSI